MHSSPLTCDPDGDGSPDGPGDPSYKGSDERFPVCPTGLAEYNRGSSSNTISGGVPAAGFLGTDPNAHDTNKDGHSDGKQVYPDVLTFREPGARVPVYTRQFGGTGRGGGLFTGATELSAGPLGQVLVAAPDDKQVHSYLPREGVSNPFTGQGRLRQPDDVGRRDQHRRER